MSIPYLPLLIFPSSSRRRDHHTLSHHLPRVHLLFTLLHSLFFLLFHPACIATVVRQSIFNNENRTLGEFRRKLAALIAKKKAKMAKLQNQLTALKAALTSPDAPLSDLFPLIGAHYQEFTKVCTNFASTSAEGKAALQEMLQVLAEPVDDKSTADAAGAAAGSEVEVSVTAL